MGKPIDLVQGTLDFLILKAIELEPRHGWAIAKRIQQISGDVLKVPQGSLYPALYRLERQGWITAARRTDRVRPGRQVLLADALRSRPPQERTGDVGSIVGSDQPCHPRHLRRAQDLLHAALVLYPADRPSIAAHTPGIR